MIDAIGLHHYWMCHKQFHKHCLLSLLFSVWLACWKRLLKRLSGACQLKQNICELYVMFVTLFSKASYLVTFSFSIIFSISLLTLWLQQNNLFKAREEKYQSRIRVLEALASGTIDKSEVSQIVLSSYFARSIPILYTFKFSILAVSYTHLTLPTILLV